MRFYLIDFVLDQALFNLVGHIRGISLPLVITKLEQASVEELGLLDTCTGSLCVLKLCVCGLAKGLITHHRVFPILKL
jgi:hypothetical protein